MSLTLVHGSQGLSFGDGAFKRISVRRLETSRLIVRRDSQLSEDTIFVRQAADGAWVESLPPEAAFRVFPRRALALADRLLAGAGTALRPRIRPADLTLPAPLVVRPLRVA